MSSSNLALNYSVGVDLGGSSIKCVAVTRTGRVLARANLPFEPDEKLDWARKIKDLIQKIETQQKSAALAVGLSAPGLASKSGRTIASMPGRLQGLETLDWTRFLKRTKPVRVLNDAHAALLGELWLGAARGFRHVFMLTLGTGVGGAILIDGKLLRGVIGRAGHIGHICLNPDGLPDVTGMPGSLEDSIGNCTIRRRSQDRFATTYELVAAYRKGNADAARIWLKSVRALACGIGSLVNALDPEAVIVGGGIARCGAALFSPLRRFLKEVEWTPGKHRVKIRPAKLGEFAGAFGAAFNAHSATEDLPSRRS